MTVIPPGAQLAPIDLPPPPPRSDPREPSPSFLPRRGTRTPSRVRSPGHSRSTSPARPTNQRSPHTDPVSLPSAAPTLQHFNSQPRAAPLYQPTPQSIGSDTSHSPTPTPGSASIPTFPVAISASAVAYHHLSRPSSPVSVHSSSSAIFERDIELPVASLSLNANPSNQTLNHKPSRLLPHGSALDHSVPSVLDDAVEALSNGNNGGFEGLEIETAVPAGVGMVRQSSASLHYSCPRKISLGPGGVVLAHSRSPSPGSVQSQASSVVAPIQSPPILGQLSTQQNLAPSVASSSQASPTIGASMRPPLPQRASSGPQLPGGWGFKDAPEHYAESGQVADAAPAPNPPALTSHLTPTKEKRRISYISYNDLLLSVPTTVTSLGEITSGNLSPDHLPGTVSPSMSSRSPVMPPQPSGLGAGAQGQIEQKTSWDTGPARGTGLGLGEGEWEREGLGKGLEQRLEDLAQSQSGKV